MVVGASAAPFQLVSVRDPAQGAPAGGSGGSWAPLVTPDGRYVLFASTANNLLSNSNPMPVVALPKLNVFLRDRNEGTTRLVSANLAGAGGGDGDSIPTGVSTNGRYALFESSAGDLVPGDTNGLTDVFLRDMWSNTTVLVSLSTNGSVGNGVCRGSTMTPDGRYVAFTSAANDLVADDTNGIPDVFVRDLQGETTTLVSVGAMATNRYFPSGSESPDITPDGRYVTFYTAASNLVPGVTNGGEIYARDLVAGTTLWVSADAPTLLGVRSTVSFNQAISADGRFVAYEATSNPPPASAYAQGVILRFNLATGLTDLVSTNAYVPTGNPEEIRSLDMSPDGRFITFVAKPVGLTNTTSIELWDAQSGRTLLVSANLAGELSNGAICDWPEVDPSGRFVGFLSSGLMLATNNVVGDYHLYVRDMQAGATTLVDVDTNGVGSPISPATAPRLNGAGSVVAFESPDAGLVPNDRNHDLDVFVRALTPGTTELISAHDPRLPCASPNGPSQINAQPISADGRFIVFSSDADNVVANDTNGFRDVFVRDLFLATNILVSVGTNGASADGLSSLPAMNGKGFFGLSALPAMSGNGRYVTFSSTAHNLVPGDSSGIQDIFLRDLVAGTTALVSVNTNGTGPGNGASESSAISADGRFVLFSSKASNLAPVTDVSQDNLFLRDMQAGVTYALTTNGLDSASMSADGRLVAFSDQPFSFPPSGKVYIWDSLAGIRRETYSVGMSTADITMSPDGSKVAYLGSGPALVYILDRFAGTLVPVAQGYPVMPHTGLSFSTDGSFLSFVLSPTLTGMNQVYLYDYKAQQTVLVSHVLGSSTGGNGPSDSAVVSADGRFVAYRSLATDLLPTPPGNHVPNLFLYDRLTGSNELLSANRYTGEAPDDRSLLPAFSADGRTLVFQTWGSDLVPQDFNHWDDILALAFLYVSVSPGGGPGQGAMLSWPARPGETYQVQFKDALNDPLWQTVPGSVSINGNQAHLTDPAPSASQRFYRVVATTEPHL